MKNFPPYGKILVKTNKMTLRYYKNDLDIIIDKENNNNN